MRLPMLLHSWRCTHEARAHPRHTCRRHATRLPRIRRPRSWLFPHACPPAHSRWQGSCAHGQRVKAGASEWHPIAHSALAHQERVERRGRHDEAALQLVCGVCAHPRCVGRKEGSVSSHLKMVECVPYRQRLSELGCAKQHARSYASHHVTSKKRHVGKLALCFTCIDGRDRMQALGLVPVERLVRGVKITRSKSMEEPAPRR